MEVGKKLVEDIIENKSTGPERRGKAKSILEFFSAEFNDDNFIDLDHFADLWLAILVPEVDKLKRSAKRKQRVFTLRDVAKKGMALTDVQLDWLISNCRFANTLDEMIAACIIGVRASF